MKLIDILKEIRVSTSIKFIPHDPESGFIDIGKFGSFEYNIWPQTNTFVFDFYSNQYFVDNYLSEIGSDEEYYPIEESDKFAPILVKFLAKYKPTIKKDEYGVSYIEIPYDNIKEDIDVVSDWPKNTDNNIWKWKDHVLLIKIYDKKTYVYDENNKLLFKQDLYANTFNLGWVVWAFKKVYPNDFPK